MDVRQIAEIHHGHIHADASPDGRRTMAGHHRRPVGKAPEKAVGVPDGQHAHPGLSRGVERPAIADVRIRVKGLNGGNAGFQGHHRPQAQPGRVSPHAVQGDAGTHHVQVHLRVAGQRTAVGTVADGKGPPLRRQGVDDAGKHAELLPGVSLAGLIVLVGGGKVGKDALRLQMGQVTGPGNCLHAAVKVAVPHQKAQAAHAGIHLDVDLQPPAAERGGSIVFLRLGLGRDGLGNVVADQLRHHLRRRVP